MFSIERIFLTPDSVQVNIPAESGEMGVLANHVPSIEQLKPGMIEIIEESGGNKQFFCKILTLSQITGTRKESKYRHSADATSKWGKREKSDPGTAPFAQSWNGHLHS